MAKPIINDLKVECRDRFSASEHGYGSVMWNDGTFRYHFWTGFDEIKPNEERQRSTGRRVPRIYKNPIVANARRFETRYLDADSATWRPVVTEIVKRIADEGMIEKAKQAKLDEIAKEDAEREEAIIAKRKADVFGTHGERLRSLLGRALSVMASAAMDTRRGKDSQGFWQRQFDEAKDFCDECDKAIGQKVE